jgi:hypothetical protein
MAGQAAQQRLPTGQRRALGQKAVDQRLLARLELLAEIGEGRHVRQRRWRPA